jgi:hypothetical protein
MAYAYHEHAKEVYESVPEDTILHVAIYDSGLFIVTHLEGTYKGIQDIYLKDQIIATSRKISCKKKRFVHDYHLFKVFSTDYDQWIKSN